jgi:hypothetical protein
VQLCHNNVRCTWAQASIMVVSNLRVALILSFSLSSSSVLLLRQMSMVIRIKMRISSVERARARCHSN